tara:strand:+ start:913 stop:1182 length:270 start_codon:yes stop_codon:yes gene_type:complete
LLDTLNKLKFIIVEVHKKKLFLLNFKKKLMQENSKNYEFCIELALDNARKRINVLNKFDKKCVLAEYKEWIQDGLSKHSVLLLRDDPII